MPRCSVWVVLLILAVEFLGASCREKDSYPPFPRYPVHYTLQMSSAEAQPLLASGGYVVITQPKSVVSRDIGLGGLLVVHSPHREGAFYAYDLACPVERDRNVRIFVNDRWEAECHKCGNRFDILYGTGLASSSSSVPPLQVYRTQLSWDRTSLLITN